MNKAYIILLLTFFSSSCSFFKNNIELSESVSIKSSPIGAEVYSQSGEFIGVTPLKLTQDKIGLIQKDSIVLLSVRKNNYIDQHLAFKNMGVSEVQVNLVSLNDEMVKKLMAGSLSSNVNDILKKLIQVQEGIITKKLASSEEIIEQLIKDYPAISAFYTLQAAIDIQHKKYSSARILLEKSLMLDSTNELSKSYLNYVNKRSANE